MSIASDQHPIFKKDPSDWMQCIGTHVEIITRDGGLHSGSVYTVDPVSESVVLATVPADQSDKLNMEIILGHAIQSWTPLSTERPVLNMDNIFKPKKLSNISSAEMKLYQERLRSWLLKNRLPVAVCEKNPSVLIVADILRIEEPYTAENCLCTNEIVLGRIQGLIKNMPVEESPNSCI